MTTAYGIAWLIYGLGAVALLAVAWRITKPARREWRHLLVVSAAALLLTPGPIVVEEQIFLAPALFIAVLDALFEQSLADASRSGMILLGVWLVALVLSLVFQLLVRPKPKETDETRPPAAEE